MKLLTRRQIIEEWQKQKDEHLDTYCCPYCRDLLFEGNTTWLCGNEYCDFEGIEKSKVR